MFSLFRRNARKTQPAHRAHASFRPRLEVLEDRLCPSGGLLDPTFGSGGIVNLPTTTDSTARGVAVQPDGKVVIAGVARTANGNDIISVQRLNSNGTLDTTFNRTGSVTIAGSSISTTVALQPDGKILIGGSAAVKQGKTYIDEPLVARLNPNGTLDTTFGNKGLWVSASLSGSVDDLAVLTDPAHPGTVTGIVGAVENPASFEAIKLTPAGVPDQTFGSGGFAVFANLNGRSVSVAVDPLSGEIYLAGYNSPPNAVEYGILAALTTTGALDTAFGGGAGYVLGDSIGEGTLFYDVAVQTVSVNGQSVSRIIVAGQSAVQLPPSGLVAAYTLSGALDTTFGNGGSFMLAGVAGGTAPTFHSLTVETDGSIVVGGSQSSSTGNAEMLVGHLTASGVADTSFGPDGTGFTAVQDGQSALEGLAIDPTTGDILACGVQFNTNQAAIVRLTAP